MHVFYNRESLRPSYYVPFIPYFGPNVPCHSYGSSTNLLHRLCIRLFRHVYKLLAGLRPEFTLLVATSNHRVFRYGHTHTYKHTHFSIVKRGSVRASHAVCGKKARYARKMSVKSIRSAFRISFRPAFAPHVFTFSNIPSALILSGLLLGLLAAFILCSGSS